MPKYDDKYVCPKCGGLNTVIVKDSINHDVCECETVCTHCKHNDYWAYGWYEPDHPDA
jgi:hypothetical protein